MKKRNFIVTLILLLGLVGITLGVSVAFFNYTRTGNENILAVGKINFNSLQGTSINLTNVFPVKSTDLENNDNVDSVTVTITGDTTYDKGIEYLISADNVINTVNSKKVPIGIRVTANNLGTSDEEYFKNRGGSTSIYQVLSDDTIKEDGKLFVGYITKGNTGINGTVTIKAFIDGERIAISDTYDGNETDNMGTTNSWVNGRTVLTTSEWNSLNSNGLSFKIKVEANEGVWVENSLRAEELVRNKILEKINAQTNACNPIWVDNNNTPDDESDDITYFSGTNDCVDMNYVWYSGKLWRIVSIYPDGTMKLITENSITAIAFSEGSNSIFLESFAYQWLNEEFFDTLYQYNEILDTSKQWNVTNTNGGDISINLNNASVISSNVGLLNSYEYYNSYRNLGTHENGYLVSGYIWRLINQFNNSFYWSVGYDGYPEQDYGSSFAMGVRPAIYLKSTVRFTGSGTVMDPFRINNDKETGKANDLVNTRLSGEYIKFASDSEMYRIIGIENNTTKIISDEYGNNGVGLLFSKGTNESSLIYGSGNSTDDGTWYKYLNETLYPSLVNTYGELFTAGTYYMGVINHNNYKLGICASAGIPIKTCEKTSYSGTFNAGIGRYGEMFNSQHGDGYETSQQIYTINRFSNDMITMIQKFDSGGYGYSPLGPFPVYPTLHLKSTVKILSGAGTKDNPYIVGL